MNTLECVDCQKTFLYATKKTIYEYTYVTGAPYPAGRIPVEDSISCQYESYHCPYCDSLNLREFEEPQKQIVSVKSVDLSEVDKFLAEGYTVKELYAKTATLIKLSPAETMDK